MLTSRAFVLKAPDYFDPMFIKVAMILANLNELYEKANSKTKNIITGSIFPEKPAFDVFHSRAARLNEAVS